MSEEDRNVTCKYLPFSYRNPDGSTKYIQLPLVPVFLKSESAEFQTVALVDSGATSTLLPRDQAEILKIKYEEDKEGKHLEVPTVGAGGSFSSEVGKVKKVQLLKNVTPFCTFLDMRVLVPQKKDALPYMILGRDLVFKRFDITFYEKRRKLTFVRI
jgi:hypothetical protein